jgi:hypothetical protein
LAKEEARQEADQEGVEPEVTHMEGLGLKHKGIHFGVEVIMSQVDLVVNGEDHGMVAAVEVQEKQAGQTVG